MDWNTLRKQNQAQSVNTVSSSRSSSKWDNLRTQNQKVMQEFTPYESQLLDTDVDDWMTRAESTIKSVEDYRRKNANRYDTSFGADFDADIDDLLTQYRDVFRYVKSNQGAYANYGNVESYVTGIGNALNQLKTDNKSIRDYYSQFSDEASYAKAVADAKAYQDKWGRYAESPYFDEKSKTGYAQYEKDAAEYAQNVSETERENRENETIIEKIGRYFSTGTPDTSLPLSTQANTQQALSNDAKYILGKNAPQDDWTQEQRDMFGYLYALDRNKAEEWARTTNISNAEQKKAEKLQKIQTWIENNTGIDKSNPVTALLSGAKSALVGIGGTMAAVASMPTALIDSLAHITEYNATGTLRYSDTPTLYEATTAITSAISNTLNNKGTLSEKIPVIGGKGLGDAYQLGLSIINSIVSANTQGPIGTYLVFFGSAMMGGIEEARNRGANDDEAITFGVLSGLAEAAGEMFSAEKLLEGVEKAVMGDFFKSLLLQAGIEASEEVVTTVLNRISDALVMHDKREFNITVQSLMNQNPGMSEAEAKKEAWLELANGLAFDALGGFISGGTSMAIQTGFHNAVDNVKAYRLYSDVAPELVSETLDISPNNKYALAAQSRLNAGKEVTANQLRGMSQSNDQYMREQDMQTIRAAVENRLTELGESGNIEKLADIITGKVSGEELSIREERTIDRSAYGQQVLDELDPVNIREGTVDSAWAEKLNTQSINPVAYSRLVGMEQQENVDSDVDGNINTTHQEEIEQSANESVTEAMPVSEQIQQPETPVLDVENTRTPVPDVEATSDLQEDNTEAELQTASEKYGKQAAAMRSVYNVGQNVTDFDAAFKAAFEYGNSGVSRAYAMNSESTAYLSEEQRGLAYDIGRDAANVKAKSRSDEIRKNANGKTGRKRGTVTGQGVTGNDLQAAFGMNGTQVRAYNMLRTIADITGIDIVLYKSKADAQGNLNGEQGRYSATKDPGTLYIDINAGLNNISGASDLAKYTMMRTFSHEFTHFLENWSPEMYNDFRSAIFEAFDEKQDSEGGEYTADALIRLKMKEQNLSYDMASREVVAEAMTDVLPQASFVNNLAEQHKNIFEKLLEKLKEFVQEIKSYFENIGANPSREANILRGAVGYAQNIVDLFDRVAEDAVNAFQSNYAIDDIITPVSENIAESASTGDEATTSDNGYTITRNSQYGSLEIKFNEKPSEAVRNVLKGNKFRWNGKKGIWYGKTDRDTITAALDAAYSSEQEQTAETPTVEEVPAPAVNAETQAEDKREPETELQKKATKSRKFKRSVKTVRDATEQIMAKGYTHSEANDLALKVMDNMEKAQNGLPVSWWTDKIISKEEYQQEYETPVTEKAASIPQNTPTPSEQVASDVVTENIEEESNNGNGTVDRGSEGLRRGSSGRGNVQEADALTSEEQSPSRDSDGSKERIRDANGAGEQVGSGRNGPSDSKRNSKRVRNGSNAGSTGERNGEDSAKLQEPVRVNTRKKQNTRNYRITEDIDSIRPNYDDNIAAIKLVKQLISENRPATDEERKVLSKFKGWGALKRDILYGTKAKQLSDILTPEEYKTAKDSILNAHYTSTKIIKGIYDAVQRMGFNGGNILEPSMGVGNFFGMMPQNISERSSLYGVEMDIITGTIAKNIYPDANIEVAGFQDVLYKDGSFDLVVGNVPFSHETRLNYRGNSYDLHDFFFVKALDETRAGGILALITSTGTLDKLSGKTQTVLSQKANLIAAFRLPDTTFRQNAGTEVTTDLIFLQKKGEGIEDNGIRFTNVGYINDIRINEYFVSHPENILGRLASEKNMYASERTVVHDDGKFDERFEKAMQSLPMSIMNVSSAGNSVKASKRGQVNVSRFVDTEDGIKAFDEDNMPIELDEKDTDKIRQYLAVKKDYFDLVELEKSGIYKDRIDEARAKLNKDYDAFSKKYGALSLRKNKRILSTDSDYVRVNGLEVVRNNKVEKSAIFSRPTIYKKRATSAANSSEALSIVLNEDGRVDIDRIAELTGKTVDVVSDELMDQIILTPDGEYQLIPQYLSGNIYQKLEDLEGRKGFERQRETLQAVLPKPKKAQEINAEISSHWIPAKFINDFVREKFGLQNINVRYIQKAGKWDFDRFTQSVDKYSTKFVDANEMLRAALENRGITVWDKYGDKRWVNEKETFIANNKLNQLRQEFREWIFSDGSRTKIIEDVFNRTLNAHAPMNFDALADKLDFGIDESSKIKLRDYQKAAVARIVFGGNTLLHHGVGTGKTATMIAAAHILKQNGTSKKPLFVVPNNKVLDFKNEILGMYPDANILAIDTDMTSPAEIRRTKSLIATNDWDYVIIRRSSFKLIDISEDTKIKFMQKQLDDLETAITESTDERKRNTTRFAKSLITKRKNLEEKLKEALNKPKDNSLRFEDMGVDAMFVDEAHNFKKVGFATVHRESGIDSGTNEQTTDLIMKEDYLREVGGRIVLATATPITNTVSEMYNMTLHVAPDILHDAGIYSFDAWLDTFGDIRAEVEIKPDGDGFRMKERVQGFKNGNALISLYRQFADVKQTQDVVKGLPVPERKVITSEGTDIHKKLISSFADRMGKASKGYGAKGGESILVVNNDAKAASADLRMIYDAVLRDMFPDMSIEDFDLPNSKVNRCVQNIVDEYKNSVDRKGTQFVFLDTGTGGENAKRYRFNLYDDVVTKLVNKGIPREEIAVIQDYNSDEKLQRLFDAMNNGDIRVLIGSTQKMGEGVNAQRKAVALHHLSVPYRQDNLEQREGRIIRFGNENANVRIYSYIQENSYDAYMWQMVERKAKYMAQALNGGDASDLEELSIEQVNAKQAKALATGNPLIMEKFQLEDEVRKLISLENAHYRERSEAARKLPTMRFQLNRYKQQLSAAQRILATLNSNKDKDFEITINGVVYNKRADAAEAFAKKGYIAKGKYKGVGFTSSPNDVGRIYASIDNFDYGYHPIGDSDSGNITRIINMYDEVPAGIEHFKKKISETENNIKNAESIGEGNSFPQAQELLAKQNRLSEVNRELGVSSDANIEQASDDDTQYQQRTNTLTDREVLEMARDQLAETNLTDGERQALDIISDRLERLRELQERRLELGRLYREQRFGVTSDGEKVSVDRKAAELTRNRMSTLDEQITNAGNAVLAVENKEVLKSVLKKARNVVAQEQRTRDAEVLQNYKARLKESADVRKYRDRLQKDVSDLTKWITNPSSKKALQHVPLKLQESLIPFLQSIDFTSKRRLNGGEVTAKDKAFIKSLERLSESIRPSYASIDEMFGNYQNLPYGFADRLKAFVAEAEAIMRSATEGEEGIFVVNRMNSAQLKELSGIVTNLKKCVTEANRFQQNAIYQEVGPAAYSTADEVRKLRPITVSNAAFDRLNSYAMWDNMRPAYIFDRFGDGGKAIFDSFRRGMAKHAFNVMQINEFINGKDGKGGLYTPEQARKWAKDIRAIRLSDGTEIRLPVTYIMSLMCLYNRPQGRQHIISSLRDDGGIRIGNFTIEGKTYTDAGHHVSVEDVEKIISELDPEQVRVANGLQRFMATVGAEWGNYVSVKRFGDEQFGEREYFPISSDKLELKGMGTEEAQFQSLYSLLNASYTKELNELADNRVMIYDIFDVFTKHMASMSQYNAFALPVLDAIKWLNYDFGGVSVRKALNTAYGESAENAIKNLIKGISGTEDLGTSGDGEGLRMLQTFNRAQIAFNGRVVIQQPMAITRAAQFISYQSLIRGIRAVASDKSIINDMLTHSGIAAWKHLGFYDTNVSRGLSSMIKHDESQMDKIMERGMSLAEKADNVTWGAMWAACCDYVQSRYRTLEKGSDAYYDAVNAKFDEIIYKSQVVDSVLTKTQYMRKKGFVPRAMSAFMSEPVTTADMVLNAFEKYDTDMRRGMSRREAWQNNRGNIMRTAYVYALGAVLLSAVQGIADAWRDDDDYGSALEKWMNAFKGNVVDELSPLNKLPWLSQIYDVVKSVLEAFGADVYGNDMPTVVGQWVKPLIKSAEIIHDQVTGASTNYTGYGAVYYMLQAASGAFGVPAASALREVQAAWNNVVRPFAPSWQFKTYQPSDISAVRYAYEDGYLTYDEALQALIDKGLAKDENDAFWTMDKWEHTESGYSRFDEMYDAIRNGDDVKPVQSYLIEHGYTQKELDSKVKSQIGELYKSSAMSKQEATDALKKYGNMSKDDITKTVNKWSSYVVTGIEYDDIDDEFKAGKITASRAAEMYQKYGGYSKEDAQTRVKVLQWQNEGYDIDITNKSVIEDYEKYCAPAKINKSTYYKAYQFYSNSGNDEAYSKTRETMPYINNLPLTPQQKTALARCWWAESTVIKYKLW